MPPTYITTIDPISNEPLPVISNSNVLWSSGNKIWDGLIIEQHRFDELNTPELIAVSIRWVK